MFGVKRAVIQQPYRESLPLPLIHDAGGGVTYEGYCERLGVGDSDPAWMIIRTTEAGGVTRPEYAGGSTKFEHVWADRTTLNYSR